MARRIQIQTDNRFLKLLFQFSSIFFLPLPERRLSVPLRLYFSVDTSHFRTDGLGQFQQERPQFPALLLTMNEVKGQLPLKAPVPVSNVEIQI